MFIKRVQNSQNSRARGHVFNTGSLNARNWYATIARIILAKDARVSRLNGFVSCRSKAKSDTAGWNGDCIFSRLWMRFPLLIAGTPTIFLRREAAICLIRSRKAITAAMALEGVRKSDYVLAKDIRTQRTVVVIPSNYDRISILAVTRFYEITCAPKSIWKTNSRKNCWWLLYDTRRNFVFCRKCNRSRRSSQRRILNVKNFNWSKWKVGWNKFGLRTKWRRRCTIRETFFPVLSLYLIHNEFEVYKT